MKWLTRVWSAAWKIQIAPKDRQRAVIISIFKKGGKREYSNYRGISLPVFLEKHMPEFRKEDADKSSKRRLKISNVVSVQDVKTTDQLFTLYQLFERAWKFSKPLWPEFINFEQAYD